MATHLLVFSVGLAGTIALGWWLLRRPALLDRLATFLVLTGALLVGWSALSIGLARRRSARAIRESAVVRRLAQPIQVRPGIAAGPARDIYLIVMDEYANAEVTTERFGFDNHVFLDSLRRLGFVVPAVHSNYLHTALSIPSLLNSSQLTALAGEVGSRAKDVSILHYLVENNRTVAFLKARGYRFVFFPSHWWLATRHNRHADAEPHVWSGWDLLQELSRSHLRRTLRKASILDLLHHEAAWDLYADHATRTIRAVAGMPKTPGPKFVFAHVLMPHLPIVADRQCRRLDGRGAPRSMGARRGYAGQVECLNRMVIALVTTLVRESAVPPVILLQGDHGTKTLKFEQARSAETIPLAAARERLAHSGRTTCRTTARKLSAIVLPSSMCWATCCGITSVRTCPASPMTCTSRSAERRSRSGGWISGGWGGLRGHTARESPSRRRRDFSLSHFDRAGGHLVHRPAGLGDRVDGVDREMTPEGLLEALGGVAGEDVGPVTQQPAHLHVVLRHELDHERASQP